MQAKDIDDRDVLREVLRTRKKLGRAAFVSDVDVATGAPRKVVLAKMRALIRRELLTGCACGCRGDFEITAEGRALLDAGTK